MHGPITRNLLAASLALVIGPAAGTASCDPPSGPPCNSPCSQPTVVTAAAPNVVVEVPPPNVIIRASQPVVCAEQEHWLKRCCHFGCKTPVYIQQVVPAIAVQAPQMAFQPMSMVPAAPVAMPSFNFAPSAPVAMPYFQPSSLSMMPSAPVAAPQFVLQVAPPPAAPPPAAPDAATMDCNTALRKITLQVETLTKAVDKHTDFLTSHEKRIQRIELFLSKQATLKDEKGPFTLPTDKDH